MIEEISRYFKGRPEVAAVYLFGSQARRTACSSSDVDIAILLDPAGRKPAHDKRLEYMVDLGKILGKDVHPVIMNSASEELLRQIFSKGCCIHVKDEKALSHFKTTAYTKIADFGYYREQFRKGLVRKLKKEGESG